MVQLGEVYSLTAQAPFYATEPVLHEIEAFVRERSERSEALRHATKDGGLSEAAVRDFCLGLSVQAGVLSRALARDVREDLGAAPIARFFTLL